MEMESQSVFQAETQAKFFPLNRLPVGVDDVGRDPPVVGVALHHAGDLAPVPHPLQAGHQQAAQHEQAHRGPGRRFNREKIGLSFSLKNSLSFSLFLPIFLPVNRWSSKFSKLFTHVT